MQHTNAAIAPWSWDELQQPRSVIVVSHSSRHSLHDRRNLRRMGIGEPIFFSRGVEAARFAADEGADLVLCDDLLEDMKGLDFLRILRLHPGHVHSAVLFLSTVHSRKALGDAALAGGSAFLVRPYSFPSFMQQVRTGLEMAASGTTLSRLVPDAARADVPEPSIQAFEKALAELQTRKTEPDHAYLAMKRGTEMYRTGRYGQAMDDFRRALAHQPLLAEAQKGMAMCWKKLGYPAKYRHWLEQACESLLLTGRKREAGRMLQTLSRLTGPGRDPRTMIAQSLVRRGKFSAAAGVFEHCLESDANRGELFSAMARGCMFTSNPALAAHKLSQELARREVFAKEKDLFGSIMGSGRNGHADAIPEMAEQLDSGSMGKVRDMVAVAGYTWKMYRQRGAA